MSLIPKFQIGLWNGWILSAIFLIANYLIMFIAPIDNMAKSIRKCEIEKKRKA